ncbi:MULTISPECIES: SHOCT domain-containing protein [Leeuwenhoekiella]|jgi:competence protein ComGC|uniref:SHOCT domain-containing protein n=1 Tax=Leeuwenhoekiella TaxID=283735 RepID=UPI003009B8D8|tara:strand:+ start:498 stop:1181 length:684 start_codon:yes stop_codon:yes gene_type:complete
MDKSIGVGLIVGGVIASSLYVYQSDKFTKAQKAFLLICIIFPPLQWVSILIILGINNYRKQNSPEVLREKQTVKETNSFDDKINSLKELKDKEILTAQEYNDKVKNLENQKQDSELKSSEDYKKLKSLFEDGILTKEEFENKVEILKSKLNNLPKIYFQKLGEGKSFSLGKYEEFIYIDKNGRKFENIYKRLSNNLYFIYQKGELKYFKSKFDLIQSVVKNTKHNNV